MNEELTRTVVAWATEVARSAAALPSKEARDAYLAARRRELVDGVVGQGANKADAAVLADSCVDAAERIMTELLARRAGAPKGRG
jgi:hypothetical protein